MGKGDFSKPLTCVDIWLLGWAGLLIDHERLSECWSNLIAEGIRPDALLRRSWSQSPQPCVAHRFFVGYERVEVEAHSWLIDVHKWL